MSRSDISIAIASCALMVLIGCQGDPPAPGGGTGAGGGAGAGGAAGAGGRGGAGGSGGCASCTDGGTFDAGADAAADAGPDAAGVACGDAGVCAPDEYCLRVTGGPIGSPTTSRCASLLGCGAAQTPCQCLCGFPGAYCFETGRQVSCNLQ